MSGPYHAEALERFKADPLGRAFQWWIRVVAAERFPRETITSLAGAVVRRVSNDAARELIEQYEWLGAAGRMQAAYGLFLNEELLGAVCFGPPLGAATGDLCGVEKRRLAICLERGTCVHYAPRNAASHLIAGACREAAREFGWRIFYAYSDDEAGEIGNVYQACNWLYIGAGTGRGPTRTAWWRPSGEPMSSKTMRRLYGGAEQARAQGCTSRTRLAKGKYVHFEGDRRERRALLAALRYPVVGDGSAEKPYPKRNIHGPDPVGQGEVRK